MSLSKKLLEWQSAGVMDAAQAARIRDYEHARGKPLLLHGLAGLGAATIGIGIISLVAANWDGIDYPVKLGAAGVIGLLLAVLSWFTAHRRMRLATEASVLVYYLFSIASLALLGQVYQTGTPAWQALLLWTFGTAPLLLLARSPLAGGLWFSGLTITYVLSMVAWIEGLASAFQANAAVSAAFAWPLLVVGLSKIPWMRRERARVAGALSACAWFLLLGAGALMPFALYVRVGSSDLLTGAAPLTAIMLAAFLSMLSRWYPEQTARARLGLSLALGFGWVTLTLGTSFARGDLDAVGAVAQIIYLVLLAWTSVQMGWTKAFNALTAVVALRILVVYFEVFGSMLTTGVGMITGGTLTLVMAWLWNRKSGHLARRLAPEGGVVNG